MPHLTSNSEARFRVYGLVSPVSSLGESELFDLAHVFAGGHVEAVSDQHFGVGSNLILPGRGKNMGDGWETKRSRDKDHKDWVIIKL
jgi:allantoicase